MKNNVKYYARQITPENTRLFSFLAFPLKAGIKAEPTTMEEAKACIAAIRELWPRQTFELVRIETTFETIVETQEQDERPSMVDQFGQLATDHYKMINQLFELRDILRNDLDKTEAKANYTQYLINKPGSDATGLRAIKRYDEGRKSAYLSVLSYLNTVDFTQNNLSNDPQSPPIPDPPDMPTVLRDNRHLTQDAIIHKPYVDDHGHTLCKVTEYTYRADYEYFNNKWVLIAN